MTSATRRPSVAGEEGPLSHRKGVDQAWCQPAVVFLMEQSQWGLPRYEHPGFPFLNRVLPAIPPAGPPCFPYEPSQWGPPAGIPRVPIFESCSSR